MGELLAGIGERLTERRLFALMGPAFLFWFGGFLAWLSQQGDQRAEILREMREGIEHMGAEGVIVAFLLTLLLCALSGAIVRMLDLPVLRLLEGYWPRALGVGRIRDGWQRRANRRIEEMSQRFQDLAKYHPSTLSPGEREEFSRLDARLMQTPSLPDQRMPTRLGNVLRAAELRPREKYGLESTVCWPRLWLLLPETARVELDDARSILNDAVSFCAWGALFLVWTVWAWWAVPAALFTMWAAYRRMIGAAEVYGTLVDSAFDVHRTALYFALRWPFPATPAEEREHGEALTLYLWRGSDAAVPVFTPPAAHPAAEAEHPRHSHGE